VALIQTHVRPAAIHCHRLHTQACTERTPSLENSLRIKTNPTRPWGVRNTTVTPKIDHQTRHWWQQRQWHNGRRADGSREAIGRRHADLPVPLPVPATSFAAAPWRGVERRLTLAHLSCPRRPIRTLLSDSWMASWDAPSRARKLARVVDISHSHIHIFTYSHSHIHIHTMAAR
jgi:hypothetical protein